VALAFFVYPLQALWFSSSLPSDSLREERKTIKGLKRIDKIG
jgi:hypothetical protein